MFCATTSSKSVRLRCLVHDHTRENAWQSRILITSPDRMPPPIFGHFYPNCLYPPLSTNIVAQETSSSRSGITPNESTPTSIHLQPMSVPGGGPIAARRFAIYCRKVPCSRQEKISAQSCTSRPLLQPLDTAGHPIAAEMFALLSIPKVYHIEMVIYMRLCPVPENVPSPGQYRSISRRDDSYKQLLSLRHRIKQETQHSTEGTMRRRRSSMIPPPQKKNSRTKID
ncbi:hypothetical protein F5879DRAFT_274852 [Lentinula edodes]|nr:hypothetical protein F5879DRAFT_274852 [Lentinula edodes]